MTKMQMITAMVGTNKKPDFYKRAEKKDKEWMKRLYRLYLNDKDKNEEDCRHFCFALLNK